MDDNRDQSTHTFQGQAGLRRTEGGNDFAVSVFTMRTRDFDQS